MATHLYIPTEPVTLIRRIRAHALEVAVAAGSAGVGVYILAFITYRLANLDGPPTSPWFSIMLAYGTAVFIGAGGVIALYGLLVRRQNIRRELNIEQMGWLLIGLGWAAFLISVFVLITDSIPRIINGVLITLAISITLGAFARLDALIHLERQAVQAVQAVEGDGADNES